MVGIRGPFVVNEWPCYHFIIKSNLAKDQNCGNYLKICSPYMLYIHATNVIVSWVSQKEKKKYWKVGDFTTTKKKQLFFTAIHMKKILN